ncbi:MAG: hypothetical protein Q9166_001324 [cf. Caloplaca sp. 2 TL-2023]
MANSYRYPAYGYPAYAYDYDDHSSDEYDSYSDDYDSGIAPNLGTRTLNPDALPMKCGMRAGQCGIPDHVMPAGALRHGPLGTIHRLAEEEGIHLAHSRHGCAEGGICEQGQLMMMEVMGRELGYHGALSKRQGLRIAARLSPGPPDGPPPYGMRPGYGPRLPRGNGGRGSHRQQRGGAAHGGRRSRNMPQRGRGGGQNRRRRGPDPYEDGMEEPDPTTGARHPGADEPIYPDSVEEPDDEMGGGNSAGGSGGAPQGDRGAGVPRGGMNRRGRGSRGGMGGMGGMDGIGGRRGASRGGMGRMGGMSGRGARGAARGGMGEMGGRGSAPMRPREDNYGFDDYYGEDYDDDDGAFYDYGGNGY